MALLLAGELAVFQGETLVLVPQPVVLDDLAPAQAGLGEAEFGAGSVTWRYAGTRLGYGTTSMKRDHKN